MHVSPLPTVPDHLRALGHDEPWMAGLAEMIIEFTGADTAIAAGRALDICENRGFGQAVSALTQGYLRICTELEAGMTLSRNQRETLLRLLGGMTERLRSLTDV